jgi:hypothetical protein
MMLPAATAAASAAVVNVRLKDMAMRLPAQCEGAMFWRDWGRFTASELNSV